MKRKIVITMIVCIIGALIVIAAYKSPSFHWKVALITLMDFHKNKLLLMGKLIIIRLYLIAVFS